MYLIHYIDEILINESDFTQSIKRSRFFKVGVLIKKGNGEEGRASIEKKKDYLMMKSRDRRVKPANAYEK